MKMENGFLIFIIVCTMVWNALSLNEHVSNKHGSFDTVEMERDLYYPILNTLKSYQMFKPSQYEDYFHKRRKSDLSTEIQSKSGVHVAQTYFTIEFEGKTFVLDVSINEELLPRSFHVATFLETGELQKHKPTIQERNHCYYQGHVRGVLGSQVIMSTCYGLKGCIILPDDFLIFEPLSNATTQTHQDTPHIVYRSKDVISDKPNGTCGQQDSLSDLHSFVNNLNLHPTGPFDKATRLKRDISKERKFIELMLVVDSDLAERLGDPVAIRSHVIELANYVDGFYRKLDVRVVLSDVEVWSRKNKIEISNDASEALDQFLSYRQQRVASEVASSPWVYADNVHLLYGKGFAGTTIGMASVGTMCSLRSGGVNQDTSRSVVITAATVTHEMGHNLGMRHDTSDCDCPANADCIMAAVSGFSQIRDWTDCSRDYLKQSERLGIQNCLVNVPPRSRIYGGPKCGNDIIEEGEECDCGTPEACQSRCCDATTCQLFANAQCDRGSCCDRCQYISSGTECRGTVGNECDLPEYCSGHSPDCPSNVFLENGMPCRDEDATCQEGVCLSYDMQCQTIWGSTATSGAHVCYKTVNILGDENGNCGRNSARTGFLKCDTQNVKCGKLLCSGGNRQPLIGGSRGSFINRVTLGSEKYECKTIPSEITPSDEQDPGLVRSGSMCAPGKICYKGECKYAANLTCSSTCNGRGRCNNLGHCHCDYGYAPPYCKLSGNGGSIDSGASSGALSTQVILLLVMFLVVVPVLVGGGSYVWYRWCGGKNEIAKWKRNREERLKAVRRNKRAAKQKNDVGRPTTSAPNNLPDVGFSNIHSEPIVARPPSQPRPARPPQPPAAPKPSVAPNRQFRPKAVPPKPSYPAPPPTALKPSAKPLMKPMTAKSATPVRSAPPPPYSANKTKNNSVRAPPTSPKRPASSVPPHAYYTPVLTTDSESDEPSAMSVLQRAKKFNAAT